MLGSWWKEEDRAFDPKAQFKWNVQSLVDEMNVCVDCGRKFGELYRDCCIEWKESTTNSEKESEDVGNNGKVTQSETTILTEKGSSSGEIELKSKSLPSPKGDKNCTTEQQNEVKVEKEKRGTSTEEEMKKSEVEEIKKAQPTLPNNTKLKDVEEIQGKPVYPLLVKKEERSLPQISYPQLE